MSAQFNIKAADPAVVARLQAATGLPHFLAETLAVRGISDPDQAYQLLNPSLERDWRNPNDIPGMTEVADALEAAIKRGDRILVFGDFDLDGISATTVLTRGLRALGAHATPFIPLRFEEGYALSAAALKRAQSFNPDFIVTVDCGIACKAEAQLVLDAGIELAITDHHEPSELVPVGVPVADPKCDPHCPSSILAGVGVALKLVQLLGCRLGQPHLWLSYTDFATLGTVADLMPMRNENRSLVSHGLKQINYNPRPCIAALLAVTGAGDKQITATNLSFSLIPRLNAAGRMGDAQLALDLLMCDDFEQATQLAQQLESVNDQRRSIEAELSEIAKEQAAKNYHGQRALVVAGEGWHEGVKGIVASRLVNNYGVPCLLFTIVGDQARGSGRSVGQVNLFKAVESASDLLTRFGGHEAAVGVTLPADKLGEFEERLCQYMDSLEERAFHPLIEIDACLDLEELTLENVAQLERLAPFGQEWLTPVYLARNVSLANARAVGAEKNHFSCQLTDGSAQVSAIMFHCTDIETLMTTDSVVNAAFEVQIDEWRGRKSVKAMLQSLTPARSCAGLEACCDPLHLTFVADLYATSDAELCKDVEHRPEDVEAYEAALEQARAQWEQKAVEDPEGLKSALVKALIGDKPLRPAQRKILDEISQNRSVLGIMATGRGKSLTFQVSAALRALTTHKASMFVYPLRALIADQAFHLRSALSSFGISIEVITGESSPEERARIYQSLAHGTCDIVLTTPEFLAWHADDFAQSNAIDFVVVDEAHHIGMARAGQRSAYATIGQSLAKLGAPVILALTATADDEVAAAICRELPIDAAIYDEADRPNLQVDDRRGLRNRDDYLANLIASGDKTVIYVNSREGSVALARLLRKRVPQLAPLIGFYNAGLSRAERNRVENLYREDALSVLVATSAFGEGIDISNIRHVVLYHLPFNEIEFNQMSGRAGRDGNDATIHLLFGKEDGVINDKILGEMTPNHDCMAQVYRKLRSLQREGDQEFFAIANAELAQAASTELCAVTPQAAACGVAVFRELGLIETHTAYGSAGMVRSVHVVECASKVELTDSVRYREGLAEHEIFRTFRDWVMCCNKDQLRMRLTRPILPERELTELRKAQPPRG